MSIMNMIANKAYPMGYRGTKTKSLLHFDGNVSDVISLNTVSSGSSLISTSIKKIGLGSLSGYITVSSPQGVVGAGPFTLEAWGYVSGMDRSINLGLGTSSQNGLWLHMNPGGSGEYRTEGSIKYNNIKLFEKRYMEVANTWTHLCLTGDGAADGNRKVKFYVNGMLWADIAVDYHIDSTQINISSEINNGFIDEFRLSNVVRYSNNFTPPTAAFVVD